MLKGLICLCLALSGLLAFAEQGGLLILKSDYANRDAERPQGFLPLVGLGLGVTTPSSASRTGGVPGHVKLVGSYYFEGAPWVGDLGFGLHDEILTQSGSGSNSTQSFYSELAGRYIFTEHWELGAIWNTLVGGVHRYESPNDGVLSFVGAQALKDFKWDDKVIRVGGRAMTGVGYRSSVSTFMAELEVSFGSGAKLIPDKTARTPDPEKTDAGKLVQALADHRRLFNKVVVVSYFSELEQKSLAAQRTHKIAAQLVRAGIDPKHIVEETRGRENWLSDRSSPSALLHDERVRVEFEGVVSDSELGGVIGSAAL